MYGVVIAAAKYNKEENFIYVVFSYRAGGGCFTEMCQWHFILTND